MCAAVCNGRRDPSDDAGGYGQRYRPPFHLFQQRNSMDQNERLPYNDEAPVVANMVTVTRLQTAADKAWWEALSKTSACS